MISTLKKESDFTDLELLHNKVKLMKTLDNDWSKPYEH
jgi:hypothetical protein